MRDLAKFEADLKKLSDTLNISLDKVLRKTAMDVFKGVVMRTPVDTGALRASWQVGLNKVPDARVNIHGGRLASAGASFVAFHSANSTINKAQCGDIVVISNHMDYAETAEFGLWHGPTKKVTAAGFSRQAPAGMVRVTLISVRNALVRMLKDIKL